jgi:hypothetical protein
MVLTVSFVLFPATNSFLSPSLNGLTATSPGWAGFASAQLGISNGCQNHTTSPYAAPSPLPPTGEMPTELKGEGLETPVVCATLGHSRENPPCNHDRARRRCVHRIQPRVRDDRDTPLVWDETARLSELIWVRREGKYFCNGALTKPWCVRGVASP